MVKPTNYRLDIISSMLDIDFKHHDALDDSVACANVFINSMIFNECNSIEQLTEKLNICIGHMYPGGYEPCSTSYPKGYHERKNSNTITSSDIKNMIPTVNHIDKTNVFYNKKVIFTGTLCSMTRKEAMQEVVNAGGFIGSGVTKDTDFLVMGIQDYYKFADGKESRKTKKAKELIASGNKLKIIGEDTFISFLQRG